MLPKLGKRLSFIEKKAGRCEVLGDVGTDHALLPVYAVLIGDAVGAIASDINKGPVKRARDNILKYGLEDRIEARLCPGLEGYSKGECDCFVIAGMGGNLIADILEGSPEISQSGCRFVLSPNSCEHDLRKYLWDNGFEITDEDAVCDARHDYLVICCVFSGEIRRELPEYLYYTGEILPLKKDEPDVVSYLDRVKKKLSVSLDGILKSDSKDEEEAGRIRAVIDKIDFVVKNES